MTKEREGPDKEERKGLVRTLGAYKRRLGVHYIAGRLSRLGRQR